MLMVLSFLLPIVGAVLVFREADSARRQTLTTITIAAGSLLAVLAALVSDRAFVLLRLSGTLSLCFAADMLSLFFVALAGLIWFLVQFHAFGYMQHEGKEPQFFGFFLLSFAALIGLAFAKNAVTLYLFFEFMTLASMPMVLHSGSAASRHAALLYLGYSTLGAALALVMPICPTKKVSARL